MPSNFALSSDSFLFFSAASVPCFAIYSLKFMSGILVSSPLVAFNCPRRKGGCFSFGDGNTVIVNVYTPGRRFRITNRPSPSVFTSAFAPCSLTDSMVSPNHGFPLESKIVPTIDPVCAAAFGVRIVTNTPARNTASNMDFPSLFMLFLLCRGVACPAWLAGCALLSLILALFQVLRVGGDRQPVRYRVRHPRLRKRLQSQQATIARPARPVFILVARPRQMQRRAELNPAPDDLAFFQCNHWRRNFDLRLRPRPHSH